MDKGILKRIKNFIDPRVSNKTESSFITDLSTGRTSMNFDYLIINNGMPLLKDLGYYYNPAVMGIKNLIEHKNGVDISEFMDELDNVVNSLVEKYSSNTRYIPFVYFNAINLLLRINFKDTDKYIPEFLESIVVALYRLKLNKIGNRIELETGGLLNQENYSNLYFKSIAIMLLGLLVNKSIQISQDVYDDLMKKINEVMRNEQ